MPCVFALPSPRSRSVPSNKVTPHIHSSIHPVVCDDLIKQAARKDIKTKGIVRLPTRILRITTRKTPCGEGSKTWDHYEMRIHKRIIDLVCSLQVMKDIMAIKIESGVDVEVTVPEAA